MKKSVLLGIIGILGIIHGNQYSEPQYNRFKEGTCIQDAETKFRIDKFENEEYTVMYLDGLLNLVKAKIQIDRALLDKSFYEIPCEGT